MLYSESGLKAGLLRGLEEMGYTQATEIQEKLIKAFLAGNNVVAQSQTGTGKTAAFLLPLLNSIDTNQKGIQALILAPTRELVQQIVEEVKDLSKYYGVRVTGVFGGASPVNQLKDLRKGVGIVVATPGRLQDFINQKAVVLAAIPYFVIDEVDRMLDMGFVEDMKRIRYGMKGVKQTITCSATMSDEIRRIITSFMSKFETIKVGEEVTVDRIDHSHIEVLHKDKVITLKHIIDSHPDDKIVVFTQTKRNTKSVFTMLEKNNYSAGLLNGDMSQGKRTSTLKNFKEGNLQILVATDVAARGLNMEDVGLVINMDVPHVAESYVHRIGRTGRAGAKGKAIMMVAPEERRLMSDIERVHKTKIKKSDLFAQVDELGKFAGVKLTKPKTGADPDKKRPSLGNKAQGRKAGFQEFKKTEKNKARKFDRTSDRVPTGDRAEDFENPAAFRPDPRGPRPERTGSPDRGEQLDGDTPYERPERTGGKFDRTKKSYGTSARPSDDRDERPRSPRPYTGRQSTSGGGFGGRAATGRSFGKPTGGRPGAGRSFGERSGEKSDRAPRMSRGDKPRTGTRKFESRSNVSPDSPRADISGISARPARPRFEGPKRVFGDRPARSGSDRPDRSSDRPTRPDREDRRHDGEARTFAPKTYGKSFAKPEGAQKSRGGQRTGSDHGGAKKGFGSGRSGKGGGSGYSRGAAKGR